MRRALILAAAALAAILAGAVALAVTWHLSLAEGLYCSIGVASSEGCAASPHGAAGRIAVTLLILVAMPLLAAVFGLATSAHIGRRVDRKLDEAHGPIHERLERIEGHLRRRAEGDERIVSDEGGERD